MKEVTPKNLMAITVQIFRRDRRSALVDSALDSGLGGAGLSPWLGRCVVFLGNALFFHSFSLYVYYMYTDNM